MKDKDFYISDYLKNLYSKNKDQRIILDNYLGDLKNSKNGNMIMLLLKVVTIPLLSQLNNLF